MIIDVMIFKRFSLHKKNPELCNVCERKMLKSNFFSKNKHFRKVLFSFLEYIYRPWLFCTKDFLPFSNLNNEEFLYTVKSKKLKFTHVAPKHVSNKTAFLEDINSAPRQDEKTLTKY